MARCPECGGGLGPARLFRVSSRNALRCRWCRAAVAIPRWFSLARDLLVVLAGSGAAAFFLARRLDGGTEADLLAALGVPLLAIAAGWIAEFLAPLVTVEPRDLPHWARRSRTPAGESTAGHAAEGESRRAATG